VELLGRKDKRGGGRRERAVRSTPPQLGPDDVRWERICSWACLESLNTMKYRHMFSSKGKNGDYVEHDIR
jgi:hypothetical protein